MPSMPKEQQRLTAHNHMQSQRSKRSKKERNQQPGQRHAQIVYNATNKASHHGIVETLGSREMMERAVGQLNPNHK